MEHLLHVRRFFTQLVSFDGLQPSPELISGEEYPRGNRPLALRSGDGGTVVVYLPVGGVAHLSLPRGRTYEVRWFDPRVGDLSEAPFTMGEPEHGVLAAPTTGGDERPWDWVLLLTATEATSCRQSSSGNT